jgi:hypothetical protein
MAPPEYVRLWVLAAMDMSFDDLDGFARGLYGYQQSSRTGERAWARKFHRRVSLLRGGKRWAK